MNAQLFADRYELLDPLGDGSSTNQVWRARDTHQNMLVALKVFRPGAEPIHVYGEASVLTALEGENVLRVYNADTYGDVPYIATRIAKQGSTEDFRKANPNGVPAPFVVNWIRQALVGLGACHDRGLMHRDIKPDNIFLDTEDFALLGDFGYAIQVDAAGTAPAEGTPVTIAPEMWSTGRAGRPADIYAMGVTAYRLLTGAWPYRGTRDELRALVPRGGAARLRDIAPHVTRKLADRVERAMSMDPADRFQTWREMHSALGATDLYGRVWRRRAIAESGHEDCWLEAVETTGATHKVCVIDEGGGRRSIDVRHASGAGRRRANLCKEGLTAGQLRVALKRTFDDI